MRTWRRGKKWRRGEEKKKVGDKTEMSMFEMQGRRMTRRQGRGRIIGKSDKG